MKVTLKPKFTFGQKVQYQGKTWHIRDITGWAKNDGTYTVKYGLVIPKATTTVTVSKKEHAGHCEPAGDFQKSYIAWVEECNLKVVE